MFNDENRISDELKQALFEAAIADHGIDDDVIYKKNMKFCIKFTELIITRLSENEFELKIKNNKMTLFNIPMRFDSNGITNTIQGISGMIDVDFKVVI